MGKRKVNEQHIENLRQRMNRLNKLYKEDPAVLAERSQKMREAWARMTPEQRERRIKNTRVGDMLGWAKRKDEAAKEQSLKEEDVEK